MALLQPRTQLYLYKNEYFSADSGATHSIVYNNKFLSVKRKNTFYSWRYFITKLPFFHSSRSSAVHPFAHARRRYQIHIHVRPNEYYYLPTLVRIRWCQATTPRVHECTRLNRTASCPKYECSKFGNTSFGHVHEKDCYLTRSPRHFRRMGIGMGMACAYTRAQQSPSRCVTRQDNW